MTKRTIVFLAVVMFSAASLNAVSFSRSTGSHCASNTPPKNITALLEELEQQGEEIDPEKAREISDTLVMVGGDAVPILVEFMGRHNSVDMKMFIVYTLASIGNTRKAESATEALIELFYRDNYNMWVGNNDPHLAKRLTLLLKNSIVGCITNSQNPRSLEFMEKLFCENKRYRDEAARGIAHCDIAGRRFLLKTFEAGKDSDVIGVIISAGKTLKNEPQIIKKVRQILNEPDSPLFLDAIQAVWVLDMDEETDRIIELLGKTSKDKVRYECIRALGMLEAKWTIPVMLKTAVNHQDMRRLVILSVALLQETNVIKKLQTILSSTADEMEVSPNGNDKQSEKALAELRTWWSCVLAKLSGQPTPANATKKTTRAAEKFIEDFHLDTDIEFFAKVIEYDSSLNEKTSGGLAAQVNELAGLDKSWGTKEVLSWYGKNKEYLYFNEETRKWSLSREAKEFGIPAKIWRELPTRLTTKRADGQPDWNHLSDTLKSLYLKRAEGRQGTVDEILGCLSKGEREKFDSLSARERMELGKKAEELWEEKLAVDQQAWAAGTILEAWILIPEEARSKWRDLSDEQKEQLIAEAEKKLLEKTGNGQQATGNGNSTEENKDKTGQPEP